MRQQNIRTTLWLSVVALASTSSAQPKQATQVGYVYCAPNQSGHLTPVFLDPCMKSSVGNLSCGQKLEVAAGSGAWLTIVIADGVTRWVSGNAISQTIDKFVPINIQAGPAPECKVAQHDPAKNHGPRAIYAPDPDFPASPHSSQKERTVEMDIIVGIDGRAHDAKVVRSSGKDFDEKAIETVKRWRFEPAVKDGETFETPLRVSMSFRTIPIK